MSRLSLWTTVPTSLLFVSGMLGLLPFRFGRGTYVLLLLIGLLAWCVYKSIKGKPLTLGQALLAIRKPVFYKVSGDATNLQLQKRGLWIKRELLGVSPNVELLMVARSGWTRICELQFVDGICTAINSELIDEDRDATEFAQAMALYREFYAYL